MFTLVVALWLLGSAPAGCCLRGLGFGCEVLLRFAWLCVSHCKSLAWLVASWLLCWTGRVTCWLCGGGYGGGLGVVRFGENCLHGSSSACVALGLVVDWLVVLAKFGSLRCSAFGFACSGILGLE